LWWLNDRYFYLYQFGLFGCDDDLPSHLHGASSTNRCADLSIEHDDFGMPNTGSGEHSICCVACLCLCHWRMQRRFDQQQHRRSANMWWLNDRNVYLYQQLFTGNYDLSSHFHRACSANSCIDLPGQHDHGSLSNTSRSERCVCHLAGNGFRNRGL
jgi:hypothetical protein